MAREHSCPLCRRPGPICQLTGRVVCKECKSIDGIRREPGGSKVLHTSRFSPAGTGLQGYEIGPGDYLLEPIKTNICFIAGYRCCAFESKYCGIEYSLTEDQTGAITLEERYARGWVSKYYDLPPEGRSQRPPPSPYLFNKKK